MLAERRLDACSRGCPFRVLGEFECLKQFHNESRFLAACFCMIKQRNPVRTSQVTGIGKCLEYGSDNLHLSEHSCREDVHPGSFFEKIVCDVFPSHMSSSS